LFFFSLNWSAPRPILWNKRLSETKKGHIEYFPCANSEVKQTALQATTNSRHLHLVEEENKQTTLEDDEISPLMLPRGMR